MFIFNIIYKVLNDSPTNITVVPLHRVVIYFLQICIVYLLSFKLVPPEDNVVHVNSYKLVLNRSPQKIKVFCNVTWPVLL